MTPRLRNARDTLGQFGPKMMGDDECVQSKLFESNVEVSQITDDNFSCSEPEKFM